MVPHNIHILFHDKSFQKRVFPVHHGHQTNVMFFDIIMHNIGHILISVVHKIDVWDRFQYFLEVLLVLCLCLGKAMSFQSVQHM